MSTATLGSNVKQIALGGGTFGPREVEQMSAALGEDPLAHRSLREAVGEMETSEVQKGFTLRSIRDAAIPPMPPAVKKDFEKQPLELIFNFYF